MEEPVAGTGGNRRVRTRTHGGVGPVAGSPSQSRGPDWHLGHVSISCTGTRELRDFWTISRNPARNLPPSIGSSSAAPVNTSLHSRGQPGPPLRASQNPSRLGRKRLAHSGCTVRTYRSQNSVSEVIPWQSTICIRFSSMSLPDANV